jgi:predicted dehydrogenase
MSIDSGINRREFLQTAAAASAMLALAQAGFAQDNEIPVFKPSSEDLNVGIIGIGAQGRILIESSLRIPGIRFQAVCDIWEYNRGYGQRYLKKYGHVTNGYEDYREMIEKEKNLDAVIIATPDWMHAEIANAFMESGKHVYCEKEMSNSLEKAKTMVLTQRKTGKLLQIGHQRRSNPRYIHAIDKLIREVNLLGRVTYAYGQWNRAVAPELECPRGHQMNQELLNKYGYGSMRELLNWRWFKKYGGGPIVDLGSHQIDLFSWVFGGNPVSIIASGGNDYYKDRGWYDTVLAIYEYETPQGKARAFYQVLTTTSRGGFYEAFAGVDGSITISEVAAQGNIAMQEPVAKKNHPWDQYVKQGLLKPVKEVIKPANTKNTLVDVRVSQPPDAYPLPIELAKLAHTPHLENFFAAVRGQAKLTCPAEVAYETAVAVLKANEAVEVGCRLPFKPEDFKV